MTPSLSAAFIERMCDNDRDQRKQKVQGQNGQIYVCVLHIFAVDAQAIAVEKRQEHVAEHRRRCCGNACSAEYGRVDDVQWCDYVWECTWGCVINDNITSPMNNDEHSNGSACFLLVILTVLLSPRLQCKISAMKNRSRAKHGDDSQCDAFVGLEKKWNTCSEDEAKRPK